MKIEQITLSKWCWRRPSFSLSFKFVCNYEWTCCKINFFILTMYTSYLPSSCTTPAALPNIIGKEIMRFLNRNNQVKHYQSARNKKTTLASFKYNVSATTVKNKINQEQNQIRICHEISYFKYKEKSIYNHWLVHVKFTLE